MINIVGNLTNHHRRFVAEQNVKIVGSTTIGHQYVQHYLLLWENDMQSVFCIMWWGFLICFSTYLKVCFRTGIFEYLQNPVKNEFSVFFDFGFSPLVG